MARNHRIRRTFTPQFKKEAVTRWPTEKHFASWLTLSPNAKISGGKLLGSRTQPSASRILRHLRKRAESLGFQLVDRAAGELLGATVS